MFLVTMQDIEDLIDRDKDYQKLYDRFSLLERKCYHSLFEAIVHTVISQQISGAALKSLMARLDPDALHYPKIMLETLESGRLKLSGTKSSCIKTICHDFLNGAFDNTFTDDRHYEALKDKLISYKGIGPWSVDVISIFYLKRRDIFARSDFGIRRGYAILKNLDMKDLKDAQLKDYGESLKESATIACFYLWELASNTDA